MSMALIRALVVDDEPNARQNLTILLETHCPSVEVVGTAGSVLEAVQAIKQWQPDVLLLDIEIGDGSGFDVLEKLASPPPQVIFTTAFDHYAVKAFKFSAVDYILKPIDIDDLTAALGRVEEKMKQTQISKKLEHLMTNLSGLSNRQERKMKRVGLPIQGGIQYFSISEIIRLQSQSNYTTFFLNQGREYLISRTLKEYDELLSDQGFVRIHQSHLINLEHVTQYQKADGGYVVMTDGSHVPLSKTHKDQFLARLNQI
jgi:two-component system LytT family response regulator